MKLYQNWIINEVATAGEHTNERTYVLTYIRTGQTLYPLHNFVVRGDNYRIGPLQSDSVIKLVLDLITESDQAVRAVHSCNSWLLSLTKIL